MAVKAELSGNLYPLWIFASQHNLPVLHVEVQVIHSLWQFLMSCYWLNSCFKSIFFLIMSIILFIKCNLASLYRIPLNQQSMYQHPLTLNMYLLRWNSSHYRFILLKQQSVMLLHSVFVLFCTSMRIILGLLVLLMAPSCFYLVTLLENTSTTYNKIYVLTNIHWILHNFLILWIPVNR